MNKNNKEIVNRKLLLTGISLILLLSSQGYGWLVNCSGIYGNGGIF